MNLVMLDSGIYTLVFSVVRESWTSPEKIRFVTDHFSKLDIEIRREKYY